jgi:hypothetical protein
VLWKIAAWRKIDVCVRGGPNQPLHRDPQWSIVLEEDRYKPPLFDGTNYGDWSFRMDIFLDEKGILTHISRPLAELQ